MSEASPHNLPKRFYKSVAIAPAGDSWQLELDGRTPKTPDRKPLAVPSKALAEHLAKEWDSQKEIIDLPNMTLTRRANVALDRTPVTRSELVDEVKKYAGTDLVCYLADGPTALRERQEAHFRPLRDWAGRNHGILLMTTEGVMNAPQPPASLEAAGAYAAAQDDFTLTGLVLGLNLYGSAVLSMAVAEGELNALDAHDISRVDELWQIEQWGEDEWAQKRVADQRREVEALGLWFSGLKS